MCKNKITPLLSILIPTYNGASKYITDVLDCLVRGVSLCDKNEIEIIVSNNASSDNTESILSEYEKYPFFKHYYNEENLGSAKNIILLTDTYATGLYGWVLGDDDLIDPLSIPFILETIKLTDVDYLSLGFNFIQDKSEVSSNQYLKDDVVLMSYAATLEKGGSGNMLGTFMSSAIFKVSLFRSIKKDIITSSFDTYQSIFPNGYINATAFFDKKCAYISKHIVFPIVHRKDWATSENNYMICSKIIPELYDYIISLGVEEKELIDSYNLILYKAIKCGFSRIKRGGEVDKNFNSIIVKSILHPSVWNKLLIALVQRGKRNRITNSK